MSEAQHEWYDELDVAPLFAAYFAEFGEFADQPSADFECIDGRYYLSNVNGDLAVYVEDAGAPHGFRRLVGAER